MSSGIYKITIGRWFYWGSTKNFIRRKADHFRELKQGKHKNSILQKAFDKHKTFEFEIIANVEEQELAEWEQEIIDVWFGTENCANLSSIVGLPSGMKGRKHSEETRAKMSISRTGRSKPNGRTGLRQSEETKAKISAANKGKSKSEETKARMCDAWKLRKREEKVNG